MSIVGIRTLNTCRIFKATEQSQKAKVDTYGIVPMTIGITISRILHGRQTDKTRDSRRNASGNLDYIADER